MEQQNNYRYGSGAAPSFYDDDGLDEERSSRMVVTSSTPATEHDEEGHESGPQWDDGKLMVEKSAHTDLSLF